MLPRLIPDIKLLTWRRTQVLAIRVYPSPQRPHFLKSAGADTGVYVRVGSTNRRADADLIGELKRYSRGESYDEQPMPALDSEAIDFRVASECFSGFRDLSRQDLARLRLVTRHQGRLVPTVAGVVLFGADRVEHFPDAWIQVGPFAGIDRGRILDGVEIKGYPVGSVGETIHHINRHLSRASEIGSMRRKNVWSLPPVAIREGVMNALTHTDYSQRGAPIRVAIYDNRLEIENPGLLPLGLTTEDLPHGVSKLRNRIIARVSHELDLIEQWGSGIQRMIAVCRTAGHPDPLFEEIGMRFRLTPFKGKRIAPSVDAVDDAILSALGRSDGQSTQELATYIRRSARGTRTRLARLVDRGLVREVGSGPQDPKRRYYLANWSMSAKQRLELTWIGKEIRRVAEGCGLLDNAPFSLEWDWAGLANVTVRDAKYIRESGDRLNARLRNAASRHNWKYVGGIDDAFNAHGYCSGQNWYQSASGSCRIEADFRACCTRMPSARRRWPMHLRKR